MSAQPTPAAPVTGLPPGIQLYQMSIGHYVSRALDLAARLGIADLLAAGARDASDLAKQTAANAPALARVLRLLASVGVLVEQENGAFALTPTGQLLRSDVPGSMRASVMLFAGIGIQDAWKELEWCVRTGQPAFRKRGAADAFSGLDPEAAKVFDAAMAAFAPPTAAAIAAAYDFAGARTVVDVGGGNGAILLGILAAKPALSGIVFDRPATAERARAKIAEAGLAARCQAVGGDFFQSVPSGGDVYLMKHVIHDWDDEKATAILRSVHRVLGADGRVVIAEGVYPARIEATLEGRGAAANDVNMLVSTGGRQRSESEFRALYAAAGFQLTRILPTAARLSLIEARKR